MCGGPRGTKCAGEPAGEDRGGKYPLGGGPPIDMGECPGGMTPPGGPTAPGGPGAGYGSIPEGPGIGLDPGGGGGPIYICK